MSESRPAGSPGPGPDLLESLRTLLLAEEQKGIERIRARLDDEEVRTAEVSQVLAEAIVRSAAGDARLRRALQPLVEEAVAAAVRRDPAGVARLLTPTLALAPRRSLAGRLAALGARLHGAYDRTLSPRAFRLRRSARTSGRSLADLAAERDLVHRVERVMVLDRKGVLRGEVAFDPTARRDNAVAGMLDALAGHLQSAATPGEVPGSLTVGEREIAIEVGDRAILAAVVRGRTPDALRPALREAVETIDLRFAPAFESAGALDAAAVAPVLAPCLTAEWRGPAPISAAVRRIAIGAALALLVLAAVWAIAGMRDRYYWDRYLARLRATPGIVVTEASRRDGRYHLAGLRDPLAPDPEALLGESGLAVDRVESRFTQYWALESPFVEKRAARVLEPPPGVTLGYDQGVLKLRGAAPHRWILEARSLARAVPGVLAIDAEGLTDEDQERLAKLKVAIERKNFHFDAPGGGLSPAEIASIDEIVRRFAELKTTAARVDEQVRLRLTGRRADAIAARLQAAGIDAKLIQTGGASADPAVVTLSVELSEVAR